MSVNPTSSQGFAQYTSARFAQEPAKEIRVVLLGDSRMNYALHSDSELSSLLEQRLGGQ